MYSYRKDKKKKKKRLKKKSFQTKCCSSSLNVNLMYWRGHSKRFSVSFTAIFDLVARSIKLSYKKKTTTTSQCVALGVFLCIYYHFLGLIMNNAKCIQPVNVIHFFFFNFNFFFLLIVQRVILMWIGSDVSVLIFYFILFFWLFYYYNYYYFFAPIKLFVFVSELIALGNKKFLSIFFLVFCFERVSTCI